MPYDVLTHRFPKQTFLLSYITGFIGRRTKITHSERYLIVEWHDNGNDSKNNNNQKCSRLFTQPGE